MVTVETEILAETPGVQSPAERSASANGALTAIHLPGLVSYLPMWERQRALAVARQQGEIDDVLLLLEHEHVYTNGRRGDRRHLLVDEVTLAQLGAAYHKVDRGGDITYHGPGQLVGYAIVDLDQAGLSVRGYVRNLERAIVQTVAAFGVQADIVPGFTGVWVGDEKLAAIGVKVSYGVAYHGFALNVAPDLSYFRHITPCGILDRGVTSLARLTGQEITVAEVVPVYAQAFAATFNVDLCWTLPNEHGERQPGKPTREWA
jgi:lipoate-protein ligase B